MRDETRWCCNCRAGGRDERGSVARGGLEGATSGRRAAIPDLGRASSAPLLAAPTMYPPCGDEISARLMIAQ
jgi:hypothetical protein